MPIEVQVYLEFSFVVKPMALVSCGNIATKTSNLFGNIATEQVEELCCATKLSSNRIFVVQVAEMCCKKKSVLFFATRSPNDECFTTHFFLAEQILCVGSKMYNIVFQLVPHQCCKTSWTILLLVLPQLQCCVHKSLTSFSTGSNLH